MKKIILLLCLIEFSFCVQGQILKKVTDRAKQQTNQKVDQEVNKKVDKTVDDAAGEKSTTDERNAKADQGDQKNKQDASSKDVNNAAAPTTIKAYSKYDFVPGEKVIGFEDFSTGNIGDFPAGWNTTGSAEIVTIEGKPGRWLWITKPGVFVPEFTTKYPEDFTFEFDLLHGVPIRGAYFSLAMAELENVEQPQNWGLASNRLTLGLYISNSDQEKGTTTTEIRKNSESQSSNQSYTDLLSDKYNPVHIAIWRQKERVRVYCNQEKMWDLPKAVATDAKLNALVFSAQYAEEGIQHYIGNLRLAIGAPDTRNKMLTQNKWVTHGILFDVNSDKIKPESYGTLKEIANVLKESPDLKVKIVGHTDADGSDADNLDLSKRRAAAVKTSLASDFGIGDSRMQTDGKGEGEPIDKNDTPAGKANNRRVEFIKM
ncbi:OmpA family protein [Chitinophagaceae bacterium LB-8]|uniref:OmpA family protein n=1 Tax=Paraflavisolibacter caeni TaxID=2982496 RepID=A0A9X2XVH4_9BACT|nr:OmpA family protein [Paraflavisolibacter caeni]MCU7549926.1 OmpA family protein [Paraflavisolibacter caeni]